MSEFIKWFVWLFGLGVVGFPITFRFLRHLPDRGYSLARILSLLVWGYIFWLLAVLGIAQNDLGGVLFALVLLVIVSLFCLKGQWEAIKKYVRDHWRMVVSTEIVFFVGFTFWAIVRAANPALIGTEKPMELAFINAILKSPGFPPNDPWLSGYSISYYYFGYVIVSMLIRVTGTISTVAFNLMIALLFGLVSVAAYGILNNLIILRYHKDESWQKNFVFGGWLAPLFILLVSNAEGFLEMLHARGIGWMQAGDGTLVSKFWTWLAIPEIENAPAQPFSWIPNRAGYGTWWWRASRVVQDYRMNGSWVEIIDEFPQFSYILSDMHPHVLSMPFVLLAVGVVLNIYLAGKVSAQEKMGLLEWGGQFFSGSTGHKEDLFLWQWLKNPLFWLSVLISGGIAFMNTWDFPIYVGLLALAVTLRQYQTFGWSAKRVVEFFETGILAGIFSILLYLPYYAGFDSQAGGFLPSLGFHTRGIQFWIMFVTLIVPILCLLLWKLFQRKQHFRGASGLMIAVGLVLGIWILSYLFPVLIFLLSMVSTRFNTLLWSILDVQQSSTIRELMLGSLAQRLNKPVTILTITGLLYLVWGFLAGQFKVKQEEEKPEQRDHLVFGFILLLILLGLGLTLVPEFIYLRDQFGTRMNTIFKFYFQTWILWGIAAGYAVIALWREIKGLAGIAIKFLCVVTIIIGMAYPVFAIWTTTEGFSPKKYDETQNLVPDWSLDGAGYRYESNADEMAAIAWLADAPSGVVAEAVGGSYSEYAWVSTYSGQPTVLGWQGHESQWRGGSVEQGSRAADIETLYRSTNWEQVQTILDQYHIRYVFLGSLERYAYNANSKIFDQYLVPVYMGTETTIYEYQTQ